MTVSLAVTLYFEDLPTPYLPDPRVAVVRVADLAWSYFFAAVEFDFGHTAWPASRHTAALDFYGGLIFALELIRRNPAAQYDFAWKECDSRLLYLGQDGSVTLRPSWVDEQQVVRLADLMTARQQVQRQIEAAMLSRYAGFDVDAVFEQIDARSVAAAEREHGQTAP